MSDTPIYSYNDEKRILDRYSFELLRDKIAAYVGVYLDQSQKRVLELAILDRSATLKKTAELYVSVLMETWKQEELQYLTEQIVNHETYFFRNGPHMHALRSAIFPAWQRNKASGQPIRIWSAGCATGEEAYSLAIVAIEALGLSPHCPVEIIATDVSRTAIYRAQLGKYRGRALQHVTQSQLNRFFNPEDQEWSVREEVRRLVRFEHLNLLEPFPAYLNRLDAIVCQNVTIYFQDATRKHLIEQFYQRLQDGGLLLLGFSEALWNIATPFHSRALGQSYIYYKGAWKLDSQARAAQPTLVRRDKHAGKSSPATPIPSRKRITALQKASEAHNVTYPQSGTDEVLIAQARHLIDNNQSDEALSLLHKIAPASTQAAIALYMIAHIHADRGDLERATREARRALELDVMYEPLYILLGTIYARQEMWSPAMQQLERARYLKPDSPLVAFYLADVYRALGRSDSAQVEYRRVLHILRDQPADTLIDGVAVEWIREICRMHIDDLE